MATTYNLFISHSWAYSDSYDNVVNLLEERGYFDFRNYSVPKDDPIHMVGTDDQLEDAIRRQMSNCHVVVILAGVYATYSKWIKKEIGLVKRGFASPKPILAVRPWANKAMSQVVQDSADRIVAWNSNSIVSAIRDLV